MNGQIQTKLVRYENFKVDARSRPQFKADPRNQSDGKNDRGLAGTAGWPLSCVCARPVYERDDVATDDAQLLAKTQ